MNCDSCTAELTAYLDGELTSGLAAEVESHLGECSACAADFKSLMESAEFVESHAPELELRPEIWRNVQAHLSQLPVPVPAAGWIPLIFGHRWLTAAAAAVLVLTMGTWGYLRYQESERALGRYMAEYVKARDQQEQIYRARAENRSMDLSQPIPGHPEAADNPFVVVQFSPDDNPFRSEVR
jgi:anti-sigma factor RsiW